MSSVIELLRVTSSKIHSCQVEISNLEERKKRLFVEQRNIEKEIEELTSQFESIRDECKKIAIEKNLDKQGNVFRKMSELSIKDQIESLENNIKEKSNLIFNDSKQYQNKLLSILIERKKAFRYLSHSIDLQDFPDSFYSSFKMNDVVKLDKDSYLEKLKRLVELFHKYEIQQNIGNNMCCNNCKRKGLLCDEM